MRWRIGALLAACASTASAEVPAPWKAALGRITADSLKGHVSFLASDLLEGRDTPSRGLDIAAEYIAAQFRRAGLEPAGDDGYFQTVERVVVEPNPEGFEVSLEIGERTVRILAGQALIPAKAVEIAGIPVVKTRLDETSIAALTAEQVQGKAVLVELPGVEGGPQQFFRSFGRMTGLITKLEPALVVILDPSGLVARFQARARLIDPAARPPTAAAPILTIASLEAAEAVRELGSGPAAATVTARWKAAIEKPVKLRNVVGVLRGSDPALQKTAALLTAHYDHIGARPAGDGDRIFNGANDDASGTAGVIEIAGALAALPSRPRRSLVFLTFFGEERGGLGSRHYAQQPVFPIEDTIADLNLEQIGRTDSTEGPQIANASVTGFDYSDVAGVLVAAGAETGVTVYKHDTHSDPYFTRSDNASLANLGIPAHSVTTAFQFPDYHRPGDHWDKIDYRNMEQVTRMIALALLGIADSAAAPKWDETNPKAERYLKAWRQRRGQ